MGEKHNKKVNRKKKAIQILSSLNYVCSLETPRCLVKKQQLKLESTEQRLQLLPVTECTQSWELQYIQPNCLPEQESLFRGT